jgi:2-isopropylmalate synthase
MTDSEHALWRILRNRQFAQAKFRRQAPVGPYAADFLCYDGRLVIEADGGQHCESAKDRVRDAWFAEQGFRVLRFWNNDILNNPEGVAAMIAAALQEAPLTRPLRGHPLPRGERVTSPEMDER